MRKKMKEIKYRQPVFLNGKFERFHYWGAMENGMSFISPQTGRSEDVRKSQQYTGLCDKNGDRIFEDDVIRCGEEVGEVQWENESAAFICLWQPQTKKKKGGADNLGSTFPSPLKEIIGNIYQNPELLKG